MGPHLLLLLYAFQIMIDDRTHEGTGLYRPHTLNPQRN